MNTKRAYEILDLTYPDETITHQIIKKQYRLKALQYHPDKNKSPDAVAKFQEIHEAYDILMKTNEFEKEEESDEEEQEYTCFLFSFLKEIFKKETVIGKGELMTMIFKKLLNVCEEKALETLDILDKMTLLKIYEIVCKYKEAFHLRDEFIEKIKEKFVSKIENDETIILNPILEDLFEYRLFKLNVNGFQYAVPLWHQELVYDNSGCEITVHCLPVLEENVEIDENNNIHIDVSFTLDELWKKDTAIVYLGNIRGFEINTRLLKLTRFQTVLFSKQGIPRINTKDIYDVSKLGDVYVHLEMEN
jgi:hypothetical protein